MEIILICVNLIWNGLNTIIQVRQKNSEEIFCPKNVFFSHTFVDRHIINYRISLHGNHKFLQSRESSFSSLSAYFSGFIILRISRVPSLSSLSMTINQSSKWSTTNPLNLATFASEGEQHMFHIKCFMVWRMQEEFKTGWILQNPSKDLHS